MNPKSLKSNNYSNARFPVSPSSLPTVKFDKEGKGIHVMKGLTIMTPKSKNTDVSVLVVEPKK